jgi:ribose/xylose/arabinose/galactoside ABC-type transport system permease subunit
VRAVSDGAINAPGTESQRGRRVAGSLFGRALFGARFMTIWIATLLLLVVCWAIAPDTLSSTSWSRVLPTASVLALVAIGQMLVIMVGGIDLSIGATISLLANVLVGVAR